MTYSVYQHWDPLEVCVVGRGYSPQFYSYIKNNKVRAVFEKIAEETEEDFQSLIKLLESFKVEVIRPEVSDDYEFYLNQGGSIKPPPMTPRDYSLMLGDQFYFNYAQRATFDAGQATWDQLKGADWAPNCPTTIEEVAELPDWVFDELLAIKADSELTDINFTWKTLLDRTKDQRGDISSKESMYFAGDLNAATYTRVGRDIYAGTQHYKQDISEKIKWLNLNKPQYRWHSVDTGGHNDGTFCPVKPGLIVSLNDIPTYAKTFPDWEVVYLPGQSWEAVAPFLDLKRKNMGKWWVPGEELNDDFTNYVEQWMSHWVGYVEETVFDVNMLVIDEKNVVCNNYNKQVFDAFDRHGITPHIVNFRHRYFWDGGLHCITSDISRKGTMQDYFPERG